MKSKKKQSKSGKATKSKSRREMKSNRKAENLQRVALAFNTSGRPFLIRIFTFSLLHRTLPRTFVAITAQKQKLSIASPRPRKRKSLAQVLAVLQSTPAISKKRKAQVSSTTPPPPKKTIAPCAQQDHSAKACGLLAKLIDGGVVCDHEPVYYRRKRDKSVLKEGQLTREGVICGCCGHLFLLSKFEAHAGSGLHRPSANMFLKDGRSILQCQQDVENSDSTASGHSCMCPSHFEHVCDDICQICGDGGHLMLCDSCSSVFHADCLHLDAIPKGDWNCPTCRCGLCGLGKVHDSSCMMISCAQCQVSYHRSCVLDALEQPEEPWLCSKMCRDIFDRLRYMVGRVFLLDRGLFWMLMRSPAEDPVPDLQHDTNVEKKLTGALKLLQQCFNPIVDHQTGIDVLSQMVFNRKSHDVRRLDCSGFYTMLLMKGKQLVSVATIRTHGNVLAEMPFIGTSHEFRKQGMCKVLMQALETMLREAGLYKLLIPSISELVDTWKGSFGFKSISRQDQKQLSAGANLLSFPGTTLLYKSLRQKPVSHKLIASASSSLTKLKGRLKVLSHTKKTCSSLQPISCH